MTMLIFRVKVGIINCCDSFVQFGTFRAVFFEKKRREGARFLRFVWRLKTHKDKFGFNRTISRGRSGLDLE